MKTPPLLLGATLVFWGWQTGFLIPGVVMGAALEGARFVKTRWEFSDDEFSRIWTFCTILFLAATIYAFTDNGGPSHFNSFFHHPTPASQRNASMASARTAAAMLRWLPMVLFLFVVAQAYSVREEIPVTTISLILRRRWKKAEKLGKPLPAVRGMNVSYPYFAVCLFAASIHAGEDNSYFWGMCALLAWALWPQRSRRFHVAVWAGALALAAGLGYLGQHGIGKLQNYVQNLDPRWFSHLFHRGFDPTRSRTMLGQMSLIKTSGKIVIRLEMKAGHPPPAYLQEASYCVFRSPAEWTAGHDKDDFQSVPDIPRGSGTWPLLPGKTNTATVSVACYLESRSRDTGEPTGLLPLPTGCGKLENLPAYLLKENTTGAVLAEGPGLLIFDALYGPGATIDSPPDTNEDLSVPAREIPALDQTIARLRLDTNDLKKTLQTINGYFQNNFQYSLRPQWPRTRREETPLSRFLLRTHRGHCEYFATATVLLLRRLGIPARYAVGYAVHEGSGKEYVVRLCDAHAWCLVWNKATRTWQDFDTTPAVWIQDEASRASPLRWLSDAWSWIEFQVAKFRWGQSNLRQYLLLAMVPTLAVLLYQIFFRRKRRTLRKHEQGELPTAWPGLDSEFYLVEKELAERGLTRHLDEPLSAWLARALTDPALQDASLPLRNLLLLHYRYRFDPNSLDPAEREELRRGARACLEQFTSPAR